MKHILLFLFITTSLYGNAGDYWGINARNISLGGSQVSGVDDYTASFHNPAKLAFLGISNGVGYQYSLYHLHINLEDQRDDAQKELFKIDSPKKEQQNYSSFTFGLTLPIFNSGNYALTFGLLGNLIEDDIAKISVFDEKIYKFYRYHSNVETLLLNAGIGFKFLKHFGVGIGVAQLVSVVGAVDVQFKLGLDDDNNPANDSIISGQDLYLGVVNERAFNLSFYFDYDIYAIGFIYKQSLSLPYKIPARITLKDFNGENQDAHIDLLIHGIGVWIPENFNLGFSLDLTKQINTHFHLTLSYQRWSQAPAPYSFTSINSDANLLRIDELKSYVGEIHYRDTLNVNLGVAYEILKDHAIHLGFSYRPSVVRSHDDDVNIIDTDTLAFALGGKIKLISLGKQSLYLNLSYSLQQTLAKEEYSSYYNSFVNYGGNIHLFNLDLSYE